MDFTKDELKTWKDLILTDKWHGRSALDALDNADHKRFIALCNVLLQDTSQVIRRVTLIKLGQRGDQNDVVAQEGALRVLDDGQLRDTALFALGRVGTQEVFPVLLSYAVAGSHRALLAASKQVRIENQRDHVVELAREYLFSADSRLRDAAVEVLMQHSTMVDEQDRLLKSAEIFTDDFTFDALAHASSTVLPKLYALRAQYASGAEYKAIVRAIARIESQH